MLMTMDDKELISLYIDRNEQAISETQRIFGKYFYTIAHNILGSNQDAEECVNDVLMRLWDHIPPTIPENAKAYFTSVARSVANKRYKMNHALKRGGGETPAVLDELYDCCLDSDSVEQQIDRKALSDAINAFLETLKPEHRIIFVLRYWSVYPVDEIAEKLDISHSKVTVTLMRTRQKLRKHLELEGFL
ncbi:MAG TPA: RNA polymerase subunit sigma-70 [Ruminococcus sp.]|nr:RNA polymerase subunit sigma-70 [Ruminococcus sp.]